MAKSKQGKSENHDTAADKLPESGAPTPDERPTPAEKEPTAEAAQDAPLDDADAPAGTDRPETAPNDGRDHASAQTDDTLASDPTAPEPETTPGPEARPDAATPPPEPKVVRETVIQRRGGFVPMLLGGVVAAGVGYAAGAYPDLPFLGPKDAVEDPFVTETNAALRAQAERIDTLSERADETAAALSAIDLGPVSETMADIEDGLGAVQSNIDGMSTSLTGLEASVAGLSDRLAALDARLTEVEKQPVKDAVSPEAIAAYEREIEALKADVAAQQAAVADAQKAQLETIEAARAEIEAIAARARDAEANAADRATLAASRAALADLTTRARDGRPYAEPLAILSENGVAVPDALAQGAADGLPTTAVLISSFPKVARDALTAARAAGEAGADPGSVSGFLQRQLGARSVTPRDGDDPDAVLSRAEAALRAGDLDSVLTEVASLPEAAQTELSGWVAQARLRRDALAAAAELTQELNQE